MLKGPRQQKVMRFSKQRRNFLKEAVISGASFALGAVAPGYGNSGGSPTGRAGSKPNVVFVFADQWRAQATGYAGDPNVMTPNLDRLAAESVSFPNAVSCCPVCSPYRATLMTGQYPLTHGVFMNDVQLKTNAVTMAQAYKAAGYDTAYIGKWHLDGHGRSSFIPKERRLGFEYFKAMECTHDYNNSYYYADEDVKLKWPGYDAIAQTEDASRYIVEHREGKPFLLVLSWGPPHNPYLTAPGQYQGLYKDRTLSLRPNVPADCYQDAQNQLRGYYAHISALDHCIGELVRTLNQCGLAKDTIFVFTSDHGDMLYSHGQRSKQRPWDESIRVPFLLRYPAVLGNKARTIDVPFNSPDILPTLLRLSSIEIPASVEGADFSDAVCGMSTAASEAALIMCPAPFGEWQRAKHGGKEYRGIRTQKYTYVRDIKGPWLLYDNQQDPCQLNNLCNQPEMAALQNRLDAVLSQKLQQTHDEFRPAAYYLEKWSYTVDETGTVPYTP